MKNIRDNFIHDANDPKYYVVVNSEFIDKGFTTPEEALVYGTCQYSTNNVLVVQKCEFYLDKMENYKNFRKAMNYRVLKELDKEDNMVE